MKIRILVKFVLLTVLTLVLTVSCCRDNDRQTIVIISTNDIHSAIDRFPNLAAVVERYRDMDEVHVLLIDAGDRWTGNPYVDMAPEAGRPILDLMGELGYDLGTLGNHEFDNGIEMLAQRLGQTPFQNILANADFGDTPMPHIPPYKIITVGNAKIAFLGLITTATNGHPAGKDESFGNSVFYDPLETALKYRNLRDSADVFVALTHTGLDVDTTLAARMQELDLIIGGHSHDVLASGGRKFGNVLVTQTGSRLRYAGVTTITMRGGKIRSMENELIALDTVPASAKYEELVAGIKADPELGRVVGRTSEPMDKIALMNFFSDVMRAGTGAQFAFYNLGSMRIESLDGDITVGDVYAAEPFRNSPVTMTMTTEEMSELILNKFNSAGGESHTMDIYPSGLTYKIITDGQGNGTDVIFHHSYYPEREKQYTVAMSDYMDSQYVFPKRGTGSPTGLYITDLVFRYLEKNPVVRVPEENRVEIVQNF